jgi:hypothetical protein
MKEKGERRLAHEGSHLEFSRVFLRPREVLARFEMLIHLPSSEDSRRPIRSLRWFGDDGASPPPRPGPPMCW